MITSPSPFLITVEKVRSTKTMVLTIHNFDGNSKLENEVMCECKIIPSMHVVRVSSDPSKFCATWPCYGLKGVHVSGFSESWSTSTTEDACVDLLNKLEEHEKMETDLGKMWKEEKLKYKLVKKEE